MENVDNNISEQVLKVKKRIETEELSIKELKNYFNNILKYPKITDIERELLVNAVEKQIRVKFPNNAKKILGGKSAKAQELLDEIYKDLTQEFDWSNNNVGNKVKVCGSMITVKNIFAGIFHIKTTIIIPQDLLISRLPPTKTHILKLIIEKSVRDLRMKKK